MKLIEKKRAGSKISKTYDRPQTPCDRILACEHVSEETRQKLRVQLAKIDPLSLSDFIESKLCAIRKIVEEIGERRAEERWRAGETAGATAQAATAGGGCVTALLAIAPSASTPPPPAEILAKSPTRSLNGVSPWIYMFFLMLFQNLDPLWILQGPAHQLAHGRRMTHA